MANTHVNLGCHSEQIVSTYWEIVNSASGTLTFPTGSELVLDAFQDLEEAVVSQTSSGKPNFNAAVSSGGTRCVATLDSFGTYSISPAPASYPVAVLYRVKHPLSEFNPDNAVLEDVERPGGGGTINSAVNVGGGAGVFKDVVSTDLRFRTLVAGNGIQVTEQTDTVQIQNIRTTADKVSETFNCDFAVAVGDLVTPSESFPNTVDALSTNVYNNLCFGIVVAKPTTTTCEVLVSGKVTGLTGFPIGQPLFVGTDGKLSATKPVTGHIQTLGISISSSSAFFLPSLTKVIQA